LNMFRPQSHERADTCGIAAPVHAQTRRCSWLWTCSRVYLHSVGACATPLLPARQLAALPADWSGLARSGDRARQCGAGICPPWSLIPQLVNMFTSESVGTAPEPQAWRPGSQLAMNMFIYEQHTYARGPSSERTSKHQLQGRRARGPGAGPRPTLRSPRVHQGRMPGPSGGVGSAERPERLAATTQ